MAGRLAAGARIAFRCLDIIVFQALFWVARRHLKMHKSAHNSDERAVSNAVRQMLG